MKIDYDVKFPDDVRVGRKILGHTRKFMDFLASEHHSMRFTYETKNEMRTAYNAIYQYMMRNGLRDQIRMSYISAEKAVYFQKRSEADE